MSPEWHSLGSFAAAVLSLGLAFWCVQGYRHLRSLADTDQRRPQAAARARRRALVMLVVSLFSFGYVIATMSDAYSEYQRLRALQAATGPTAEPGASSSPDLPIAVVPVRASEGDMGLEVRSVKPDGPFAAYYNSGDVIVRVDGEVLAQPQDAARALRRLFVPPTSPASVVVMRDGRSEQIAVPALR